MRNTNAVLGLVLLGAAATAAAGCSTSSGLHSPLDPGTPTPAPSATPTPATGTFPSPHTALPVLIDNGGGVQGAPKFHAITFPGDPNVTQIEDFVSKMGGSPYWHATTSEYGVAAATAAAPVRMTAAAATNISGPGIEAFLKTQLDGTHPEFGTPTSNDLYMIFYQASTKITDGQDVSCVAYLAYHSSVVVGAVDVAYAVLPRCAGYDGFTDMEVLTQSASHEMIEAAVDPHTMPAFLGTDAKSGAFDYLSGGGENGDLCQYKVGAEITPATLGYSVQRTWSNAAAAASHDPCVPAADEAYFNAAPVLPDSAVITDSTTGQTFPTAAAIIPIGSTKSIELDLFSDRPTSGPFTVTVVDTATAYGLAPELTLTLDGSSGVDGDKLHVAITPLKAGAVVTGGHFFFVECTLGATLHVWPVYVSDN